MPARFQLVAAVLGYILTIVGFWLALGLPWAVLWAGLILMAAGLFTDDRATDE